MPNFLLFSPQGIEADGTETVWREKCGDNKRIWITNLAFSWSCSFVIKNKKKRKKEKRKKKKKSWFDISDSAGTTKFFFFGKKCFFFGNEKGERKWLPRFLFLPESKMDRSLWADTSPNFSILWRSVQFPGPRVVPLMSINPPSESTKSRSSSRLQISWLSEFFNLWH